LSLDELVRNDPTSEGPSSSNQVFARVPALDGVRAIAIVVVLLFHHYQFEPKPSRAWSGGFLGVDVFFVLSGFLITTLLLHEHRRAQRIDLPRFWSRRARRLLPALFVLVIGTAILAKFAYDPVTATNLRGESLATLLYVENWYRIGSAPSALSHTWSLSVEEQWYLLWPLLLGFLLLISRGRKRVVLAAVGVLAVASAIECARLFSESPDRSYYGTDTRAQTLLVGAGLALLLFHRPRLPGWVVKVGGWMALGVLGWYFYVAHPYDTFMYHGGFMLIAVLAALLIASIVRSQGALLSRALAWKPLAAIGLISYGLYLYHYPIYLWLDDDRTHMSGTPLLLLRVAVTSAVAVLSYHFIERPFRRGVTLDRRRVAGFALAGVGAFGVVFLATPSSPPSVVAQTSRFLARAADNTPSGSERVLVVGDIPAFELGLGGVYDGNSIRGAAFSMFGCDVTPGDPILMGKRYPAAPICQKLVPSMRSLTSVYKPAATVLMIGPEDARDRGVYADVLRPGSAALEQLIDSRLEHVRNAVTSSGARYFVLPVQCDGSTDVSAARVAWLDRVLARYVRAQTDHLTLLSAVRQPCPGRHIVPKATWQRIAAAIRAG
jgi:peptidoglycan/LPS O-acetylase OafA/YrhL